jgi:hypothetical protein
MTRHLWPTLLVLAAPLHAAPVEFNRDVRPILSEHCFACHGPDTGKRKAGLRLDHADGAKRVLVAKNPDESDLYKRLTHPDAKKRMPPASTGKAISPAQLDLVRRWIEQGAEYQEHWSLLTPKRPPLPNGVSGQPTLNAIDRFLLTRLRQEGLAPSAEADRRTLLRRLSFDLLGLPPSPEEVDAFVASASPDAYEKAVDRLLRSPHYGERMALFWLDLVRYGDTDGYHADNYRPVHLYRDYVINAFNVNKRFDAFTVEQLAGDLLPNPTAEQRVASGYNRMLMTTEEGGAQPKEYLAKYAADRVRNAGAVWLGLTVGCAECHNHKFDPVTTKEFYQFAAFWADIPDVAVGRPPQTRVGPPRQVRELQRVEAELAAMKKPPAAPLPLPLREKATKLQVRKQELEKALPATLVSAAGPPRMMRVLPRGNWLDDTGEIVAPNTPASLPKLAANGKRPTRLDLAKWLVSPEHPLTARVFVNRLWKLFFGQGLVTSMEDFGSQGAWPSHPELLDWLAVEFRESGWDVKHLVRLMVTSSAYRQSSLVSESLRHRDPYNRLLARQVRFRLDAELVRDNTLAVSGLLVRTIGGPSVKPYQPAGYWAYLNFPKREYIADKGESQYRRGVYTFWQRTFPHPSLIAFDAPSREECTADRPRSNTPQQALVLLNDPTYVEAARVLAAKVLRDGGASDEERLTFAYRQVLGRKPRPAEVELLLPLLHRHIQQYKADAGAAEALLSVGQAAIDKTADRPHLAAWASVARVLLNLHEAITRE